MITSFADDSPTKKSLTVEVPAEEVRRVERGDHGLLVAYPVEARIGQNAGHENPGRGQEHSRRQEPGWHHPAHGADHGGAVRPA